MHIGYGMGAAINPLEVDEIQVNYVSGAREMSLINGSPAAAASAPVESKGWIGMDRVMELFCCVLFLCVVFDSVFK